MTEADPAIERVGRPLTMYFGPETVLLGLDVEFRPKLLLMKFTEADGRIESAPLCAYPVIKHIHIEADSLSAALRKADR